MTARALRRCLGALCLACVAAATSRAADEPLPLRLDTSGVPDVVLTDQIAHLRLRAYIDVIPPKRSSQRDRDREGHVLCERVDQDGTRHELDRLTIPLPPYNDESVQARFSIAGDRLRAAAQLAFTLRGKTRSLAETVTDVAVRRARDPGSDLVAQELHLYNDAGERVMLTMDRWDESRYRRWAVPRALHRWLTLPPASPVLLVWAPMAGEASDHFLTPLRQALASRQRDLHICTPDHTEGAPILGLIAAAGALTPRDESAIVLAPGIADICYGTPRALYIKGVHALITRLETLRPTSLADRYILAPALPPSLEARGKPYLEALLRIAHERHAGWLDPNVPTTAWGEERELLHPLPAARRHVALQLAQATDLRRRQRLLQGLCLVGLVLVMGFVLVQLTTRARLRRLIAISCGKKP